MPDLMDDAEEATEDLEKPSDEVHPALFDESMRFSFSKDVSKRARSKIFDKMTLTDVVEYTGMVEKMEPNNAGTPGPDKKAAPRPVFR